jgi:hypothetical protein
MDNLNTENPQQLIYSNSILTLTLLGGIRLEGLDRMRATVKAQLPESPKPPIRHNLDLYNDTQLEKFVRKVAGRLEIGTSIVAASLSELIELLESYRLTKLKDSEAESQLKPKVLSEDEIKAAKVFLSAPELLGRTKESLEKSGIVGEGINSLILFIAMSSRKCPDPLSVICLAKSGLGKSYLMERVAACFPREDMLENTQFTENSFYYYKKEEIRGKVFLIEDLDGAQAVMYPIRELQSKKRISKTVTVKDKNGQLRTITLIVEGPVSVIGCTTKEKIYEDNANRSILIYLDGSKEQDQRVTGYQKELKAGLVNKHQEKELRDILQNAQRILQPVSIINPFAMLIDLPKQVFKPRRTMGLLLNFIEAVTFYHQYKREQIVNKQSGEIFIKTDPEDIEIAFSLLRETLFRKSDELSGACRSFYEFLKNWVQKNNKQKGFYGADIRKGSRINPRTLNRYLKELTEYNRLLIVGGSKHKSGYQFELNKEPEKQNLQEVIDKQINSIIEKVKAANEKQNQKSKPKEVSQN